MAARRLCGAAIGRAGAPRRLLQPGGPLQFRRKKACDGESGASTVQRMRSQHHKPRTTSARLVVLVGAAVCRQATAKQHAIVCSVQRRESGRHSRMRAAPATLCSCRGHPPAYPPQRGRWGPCRAGRATQRAGGMMHGQSVSRYVQAGEAAQRRQHAWPCMHATLLC